MPWAHAAQAVSARICASGMSWIASSGFHLYSRHAPETTESHQPKPAFFEGTACGEFMGTAVERARIQWAMRSAAALSSAPMGI